ncbi:hypothetical protein EPI10_016393 [Gossypium australe]|uniref:Uncharacterized protein n=1 Tax=Gossypium australe TaxID=47621 RepID=A0A5B6VNZ2_9ROSI|nr:hypothetical protein EPI10_016393 [Gossypium australe]
MLGSATKSFSNIVMSGEMIENAIRCGKIEAGEGTKRSALRRMENEVNNTSTYNKSHSRAITFTLIPVTYKELYQNLFDAHIVSPFYLTPLQPSFPKWYDASAQCECHARILGHSIENYTALKKWSRS